MSKRRKKGPAKRHSPLSQHRREGKELLPPFRRIKIWKFVSWLNERMPDQVWTGLLLTHLDRELALEILRTVAKACQGSFEPGSDIDLTLTGLAAMRPELADRILRIVTSAPGATEALQPLLLFEDVPGRDRWLRHVPDFGTLNRWQLLARTVALLLDHQSQEATDCRWARLLFKVAAGQMVLQSMDEVNWLREYPKAGDQREVRPFIRACEMAESPKKSTESRQAWARSFWFQCHKRTECGTPFRPRLLVPTAATSRELVRGAAGTLAVHYKATSTTTASDPRHVAVFGLAAFGLGVLDELLSIGMPSSVLGRLGLRAIMEAYITLSFLAKRADPALWQAYRTYGQGQAKLAFLKVDEHGQVPSFVSTELLQELANEEQSQEFASITLGHWAGIDLRKMSEEASLKDSTYDQVYPWTSAFMHANWAAVRAACFDVCGNPLHRLHLVLRDDVAAQDDVVREACALVDGMLALVEDLYPGYSRRVTLASGGAVT
jgi:hypothetical protein